MKKATSFHLSLREQKDGTEDVRPEHATVETWKTANTIMRLWNDNTPLGAKRFVKFEILFEDGYIYAGMNYLSPAYYTLGNSIIDFCEEAVAKSLHKPSVAEIEVAKESTMILKEYEIDPSS